MKKPTCYSGPPQKIWILIDTDNGQDGEKYYSWYFHKREDARRHKRQQNSKENCAKLAGPFRYVLKE